MAVVKSSLADCFWAQATTRAEGLGFMSSDSTLVSRMIILQKQGCREESHACLPGARPHRIGQIAFELFPPNFLESGKRPSKQNAKSHAPPPPSNARDEQHELLSGP